MDVIASFDAGSGFSSINSTFNSINVRRLPSVGQVPAAPIAHTPHTPIILIQLAHSNAQPVVEVETVTGAEVEALSNSVVQGTNPFHKTKVSSIASIFTEFDAKYDGEFANDHATVARVSRESLALIFDLLPPKRSTPLTVEELEDAALEVWMRLETPTQKLAFLWYPHADAPRRYKGRASLPPGKKPTAVWEVADGVREGKRLLLFGTTDKIKKNTDEPVIRIVPVPAIYGLTSSELVEICNAATWSRTEFMAVGSWLRTAIKCGEGDLRINMLRRVQATLLLLGPRSCLA